MRKFVALHLPAILLFCFFSLLSHQDARAAEPSDTIISVRAAKHADFFRIVLSGDEGTLQKAVVSARDKNTFRIDFPGRVIFELGRKDAGGNPIRLDPAGKQSVDLLKGIAMTARPVGLTLTIENLGDIKTVRLGNPARLVIDAIIEKKSQEKPIPPIPPIPPMAEKPEIVLETDAVVIDAGHGGEDKGIHSAAVAEKDITIGIARDLAAAVAKNGGKAYMTRKGDQNLALEDRAAIANAVKGVPFLSIHTGTKREVIVYYALVAGSDRSRSEALARRLAEHLGKELQVPARMDRLPGLFIGPIQSPAVLIELPSPVDTPYDKKMRDRVLRGLLKGIAAPDRDTVPTPQQKPSRQPQPKKKVVDEI